MPRKPFFPNSEFPYHVTTRSNNREWFYIPLNKMWEIMTDGFIEISARYQTEIHSFVQMSNHLHFIIRTPGSNLDDAMKFLLSRVSRNIQRISNRINHVFGGRYRYSLLDSAYSVAYVQKYIYRNPVRSGQVENVQDYRFSTLQPQSLISGFPLVEGIGDLWKYVPKDNESRLTWLNRPVTTELEGLITRGLRRKIFSFTTNSNLQPMLRTLRKDYGVEDGFV